MTISKYRNQIEKINNTWGKNCRGGFAKLLYFLGEEKCSDFQGDEYIYLPNIINDYLSASYKQYLGMKYIYENYKTDFVLCCGTDTFVNIPKLLQFLTHFDPNEKLYIGGHGCVRNICDKSYYFHSGGPGFIISSSCLEKLYPFLSDLTEKWIEICNSNDLEYLLPSCDVGISYFLQNLVEHRVVKTEDLSFLHCNHRGAPCHNGQINMSNIISCHNMSLSDFDEFYNILLNNNFYL